MSELKAFIARKIDYGTCDPVPCIEVYPKSEADKVIADLEDKLRAANEQIENIINSASSIMLLQDRVNDNKCDELRHSNYRRCLAMAKYCDTKADWYYGIGRSLRDRVEFYIKWQKRWLELAAIFKEAK